MTGVTVSSSALLPVAVMAVLLAALGPAPARAAAEPDPLDGFSVVWDKAAASDNEDASMPIGNGDIGMNVSWFNLVLTNTPVAKAALLEPWQWRCG